MSQICDKYVTTYQMITAVVCDGMRMVLYYKPIINVTRYSHAEKRYCLHIETINIGLSRTLDFNCRHSLHNKLFVDYILWSFQRLIHFDTGDGRWICFDTWYLFWPVIMIRRFDWINTGHVSIKMSHPRHCSSLLTINSN